MDGPHVRKSDEGVVSDGASWVFKATGDETGGRFDFMVGQVGHLSGPPLHVHREQEDTFYVLDGVLTVQAGDDVFDLHPGDFVMIPPGVPHTFDNTRADQPAVRTVNLMTPGGFKRFFDARATVADGDADARARIAADFGVTVVGPPLRVTLGLGG